MGFKALISSVTPFERAWETWKKTAHGEGIKNLEQGVLDELIPCKSFLAGTGRNRKASGTRTRRSYLPECSS